MSDAAALMRFEANKKSVFVGYLLWWFIGVFGAHRFYLDKSGSATRMLLITLFSILLMLVVIGFVTIFMTVIWAVIDMADAQAVKARITSPAWVVVCP